MEERISKLNEEVAELVKWMKDSQDNQIPPPLGSLSTKIMQIDHLVVEPEFLISGSTQESLEIKIDNQVYILPAIID